MKYYRQKDKKKNRDKIWILKNNVHLEGLIKINKLLVMVEKRNDSQQVRKFHFQIKK